MRKLLTMITAAMLVALPLAGCATQPGAIPSVADPVEIDASRLLLIAAVAHRATLQRAIAAARAKAFTNEEAERLGVLDIEARTALIDGRTAETPAIRAAAAGTLAAKVAQMNAILAKRGYGL